MHLEILVEDQSGKLLLEQLVPKIIGNQGSPHTWRLISYRGIGVIPKGITSVTDAKNRVLLDRLPSLLKGYQNTDGIDAVVVFLDSDRKDCKDFLGQLQAIAKKAAPKLTVLFRLAIEEIEAWYFGDPDAIFQAYPKAKRQILQKYQQDSICGTWEMLADALYPGGADILKKQGWPLPGQVKCEWAIQIGSLLNLNRNVSPSFGKFRDGLRRIAGMPA